MTNEIKPGEPDYEYRAASGLSQSTLKLYHGVTPCEAKYLSETEKPKTEALLFGAFFADLIAFGGSKSIGHLPDLDYRTKEGKEAKKPLIRQFGGNLIKWDRGNLAFELAKKLQTVEPSASLIEQAKYKELSIYWTDEHRRITCKGRADLFDPDSGTLCDIKTTSEELSDRTIGQEIAKRLYHCQLAWYRRGLRACGHRVDHNILIFVSTEPPHLIRAIRLSDFDIDNGEQLMLELMTIYDVCLQNNTWADYGDEVTHLILPSWSREKRPAENQ